MVAVYGAGIHGRLPWEIHRDRLEEARHARGSPTYDSALIRAAEGAYYYFVICRPLNFKPEFVTTHGDSVLFVVAFMVSLLHGGQLVDAAVLEAARTLPY